METRTAQHWELLKGLQMEPQTGEHLEPPTEQQTDEHLEPRTARHWELRKERQTEPLTARH